MEYRKRPTRLESHSYAKNGKYAHFLPGGRQSESASQAEPISEQTLRLLRFELAQSAFEKVAKALGKISIEFQFLETEIREAIGFLINPDEWIGKIVTGGMAF